MKDYDLLCLSLLRLADYVYTGGNVRGSTTHHSEVLYEVVVRRSLEQFLFSESDTFYMMWYSEETIWCASNRVSSVRQTGTFTRER